jgi:hypothetical protein
MSARRVRGEWVIQPVTHRPTADSRSEPLLHSFAFAGRVTVWEPIPRHLEIGAHAFGLAPGVPVTGLAAGVHVTLAGYVERLADTASRSVVTRLIIG